MARSGNPRYSPFTLLFQPNSTGEAAGPYKAKPIPVNAGTVDIENAHFKGKMLFIHDTGNEPDAGPEPPGGRKGVELQIQGRFKRSIERGDHTSHGMWVGGELPNVLKLGWITHNVVNLIMKWARKKTEGRLFFSLGGQCEKPHLSFPVAQLFVVLATPPGETPPELGSEELAQRKWERWELIDITTENTYTLIYRTPLVDFCSWELLKIPGVSPLPLEHIIGDVSAASVGLFDLGIAGTHSNWKGGALLQWEFRRKAGVEDWQGSGEDASESRNSAGEDVHAADDASENSSDEGDEEDALTAVEDQPDGEASESSNSTESAAGSEVEELSRADSQVLLGLELWRPSWGMNIDSAQAKVPYYIEAIDRRRRRKVRYWYIVRLSDGSERDCWHAKAATELASLCRPRRRIHMFRRGPGARRYTCCAVKTLEQFRHVVRHQLSADTKLRAQVLEGVKRQMDISVVLEEELSPGSPKKVDFDFAARRWSDAKRSTKRLVLPPQFFSASGSNCGLAFAHALEGRDNAVRETLVGAIHFEGRLCEELLRLSADGVLRCFTPYDCDRPRMRLQPADILHVQPIDGLFLGRFHLWNVQTILRVFVFCTHHEVERDEWVQAVRDMIETFKAAGESNEKAGDADAADAAAAPASERPLKGGRGLGGLGIDVLKQAAVVHKMNAQVRSKLGKLHALRLVLRNIRSVELWATPLTDSTRARRWRQSKRLVLNDRVLLPESQLPPSQDFAVDLLHAALRLATQPEANNIIALANAACKLKAVQFKSWTDNELLAFWLNIYHCLLLHGWMLLGKPSSAKELKVFKKRVSYLVGLRPVSLLEIERAVLRSLEADTPDRVKAEAGARARQLLGFCGFCRRRLPPTGRGSLSAKPLPEGTDDEASPNRRKGAKLPQMPRVPKPSWMMQFSAHPPCLFLGRDPELLVLPKQESRCALVLNRGTESCLPDIPVFHSRYLSKGLNDVARAFVATLQVTERDGRAICVLVPESCKALAREFQFKDRLLLEFLWRFMPPERAGLQPSTRLKFCKGNEEPRDLAKFACQVHIMDSMPLHQLAIVGALCDDVVVEVVANENENGSDCELEAEPPPKARAGDIVPI